MRKAMKVSMIGTFSLQYDGISLKYEDYHSLQMTRLLSFIFLNRHRKIANGELASYIFRASASNPLNGLKALVYRTRTLLKNTFGNVSFIMSDGGYYFLNDEIDYILDLDQMHDCYLGCMKDPQDISIAKKGLSFYHGDLLPMIDGEAELTNLNTNMILEATTMIMNVLLSLDSSSYEFKAFALDLLEENMNHEMVQVNIIRNLLKRGEDQKARDYFEVLEPYYEDYIPVRTIEYLSDLVGEKREIQTDYHASLENDASNNALECTPHEFGRFCQLRLRRLRRGEYDDYVVSLTYHPNGIVKNDIKKQLLNHLRVSDCVTQFDENQFFVLLQCDEKYIPNIIDRLSLSGSSMTFDYKNLRELRAS